MARAPVSKTGGWGFESLHSCQVGKIILIFQSVGQYQGRSETIDGSREVRDPSISRLKLTAAVSRPRSRASGSRRRCTARLGPF